MAKENACIFIRPVALGVGTAVADGVGHPAQNAKITATDETSYAAHGKNDQRRS